MAYDFKKILIINPGGIGDLIMFSPALKVLKNNFSESLIDMLVSCATGKTGIFQESKIINKVFFFNFKKNNFLDKIRLILNLRKEKYDLVFVANGVGQLNGSVLALLIGGKERAGEYRKFKLNFYNHQVKLNGNQHKTEANLNILKSLGIKTDSLAPDLFFEIADNDKKFADEFIKKSNLENKTLIGFSIGSGTKQQFKLWPNENFKELGKKILGSYPDAFILLFGSAFEKDICFKMQNELNGSAESVIGFSLSEVASLIDKCRIFISSDTGLCHIAATTNTDLIVIFGPTIAERTGPFGKNAHIISEKCSYQYHDVFTPKYDFSRKHSCLIKITPDIVFNKINEILKHG
ncbi:MAG: glycosyltransferase family 9 protein [Patescibacteria group bacterium]